MEKYKNYEPNAPPDYEQKFINRNEFKSKTNILFRRSSL